jgi:thioredoxin reductase (NADPH)
MSDAVAPPYTTAAPPGGGVVSAAAIEADAVVIGAGPVGLFQVFQLGLQGLRCHVVDALPELGGQCTELYADKPIYDIPALPACTGAELVDRLRQQIAPFAPVLHLGEEVEALSREADGRLMLQTSRGSRLRTATVVIAAGVGAFTPRRLKLPGLEGLCDGQPSHASPLTESSDATDAAPAADGLALIHGGDDRALDWALGLAARGTPVALLYRRAVYTATAERIARFEQAVAGGRIARLVGQPTRAHADAEGRLSGLDWTDVDGRVQHLALRRMHVSLGLSPRLGPLADWGLAMARKQLAVDPATFETSWPGVHAVGDIVHYPGKLKLILCGFHEATLAAWAIARRLAPDAPHHLEYTTSSLRLQTLLGVAPPGA